MKATLVVVVIASVVVACSGPRGPRVPLGYYDCLCQQPKGTSLDEWLGNLEWYGEIDLSGGGWDCSQISAYVQWLAMNCGYDAVLAGRRPGEGMLGHVWVEIDGRPYESTGLYWINLDTADPGYYTADRWLQNIYEAIEYTTDECTSVTPEGEWGWWLTYPELYK